MLRIRTPLLFAAFAGIAAGVIMIAMFFTHHIQTHNRLHAQTISLQQLISPNEYDNDLLENSIHVTAQNYLGNDLPHLVYRAYLQNKPVALLIHASTYGGYAGPIQLLIGVRADNTLLGVRVLSSEETPGLGDQYQKNDGAWLKDFEGKGLQNPPLAQWNVKKSGGAFDQWTGATVTPQAIVKSVARVLSFTQKYSAQLFSAKQDVVIHE